MLPLQERCNFLQAEALLFNFFEITSAYLTMILLRKFIYR